MTFTKLLTLYAAAGAITIVAWILNVSQLYWMAGTLLLLPTACKLLSRLELRGLSVTRQATLAGHQGEAASVRLSVTNHSRLPKLQLALADDLPSGLAALPSEPIPVQLGPNARQELQYTLQLRRRGAYSLATVAAHGSDPLGVAPAVAHLPTRSEILVYPRIVPLPLVFLQAARGGGSARIDSTFRKGEGSSFFGIREYRPGDPLRHVHWRTAARLGRLTVIEWESEESTDAVLAIETGSGSERPLPDGIGGSSTDALAGLAASLASELLSAGDSVRLLAPDAAEWRPAPERGIEALPDMLASLARMKAASETPLDAALRRAAPQLTAGTLICWLTADPSRELVETVRYLTAMRLRPVVYALELDDAGRWQWLTTELARQQVPVIRLSSEDGVVRELLT